MAKIQLLKRWPHQQEILSAPQKHRLLVTGRRAGKTQTATQFLILQALQRKGVYWWVAPDLVQGRVAERMLWNCLHEVAQYRAFSHQFTLPNGSLIELRTTVSKRNLRGEGLAGVVVDEAAFQPEEVYFECLLPALKDKNGWAFLASTPNGHNWYYEYHLKIKSLKDWLFYQCPSWLSPLMPVSKYEHERAEIGDARWRQEYGGVFTQSAQALFHQDWLKDIAAPIWPSKWDRGVIAVDMSLGHIHSDYQALVYLGFRDQLLWADCAAERMSIENVLDQIKWMYDLYKPEAIAFETNSWQELVAARFMERFNPCPPVFQINNKVKKEVRIGRLASLLRDRGLRIRDNPGGAMLLRQLADFPGGDFDDLPDALEMAWRYLCVA